MMKLICSVLAALVAVVAAGPTTAAVITSIPGGTVIAMPALGFNFSAGPQIFGGGTETVTWTSATSMSVFGYTDTYVYNDNGIWSGLTSGLIMAATNDSSAAMTFAFSSPVTEVGGFVNYAFYMGDRYSVPEILAYDSSYNLIESAILKFSTGGGINTGFFYGFAESTPIAYFKLQGAYIGLTDLTIGSITAVPEPSTWGMVLLGFAGLGFVGYRRSRRSEISFVGCRLGRAPMFWGDENVGASGSRRRKREQRGHIQPSAYRNLFRRH